MHPFYYQKTSSFQRWALTNKLVTYQGQQMMRKQGFQVAQYKHNTAVMQTNPQPKVTCCCHS